MKSILTIAILVCLVISGSAQPTKARLDSLMDFYAKEYNFNGVAFISWKGEVLLDKGYGYRDIEHNIKNDKNSIFRMGSNTKQFTSEVILMLAKENKLGLQDRLSEYYPDYPSGDKISIENLLTHTSGIYNYTEDTVWNKNMPQSMNPDTIFRVFANKPLQFAPGEKFEYSNSNYILLGNIIEKVTGEKYGEVVKKRILVPLGMTHSGFDYTGLKDKNKTAGYYTIQGELYNPAPLWGADSDYADGGLYSDAADMFKWHNALMGNKLLPEQWQEKAFVPHKGKYGYGWIIDSGYGKKHVGHSGGVPGFYTYEMRIPEDNVCILLLQNCEIPNMDNNTICINILKSMYVKNYKLPSARKVLVVSREILQQYVGVYNVSPGFSIDISLKGNDLYAQATDQDKFLINAESETRFFNKTIGIEIDFDKDEQGKVNQLIIVQGGQKVPAKRM